MLISDDFTSKKVVMFQFAMLNNQRVYLYRRCGWTCLAAGAMPASGLA
jgi:hypothetical protein